MLHLVPQLFYTPTKKYSHACKPVIRASLSNDTRISNQLAMASSTTVTIITWAFVSIFLLGFVCVVGGDLFQKWRQEHIQESFESTAETSGGMFTRLGKHAWYLLGSPGRKINECRRRRRTATKDVENGKEAVWTPPQWPQSQSTTTRDNPYLLPYPCGAVTDHSNGTRDSVVPPSTPPTQPTRALLGVNGRPHPHGIFANSSSNGLSYGNVSKNCSLSRESGVVSTGVNNWSTKVAASSSAPPCLLPSEEWGELSLDIWPEIIGGGKVVG